MLTYSKVHILTKKRENAGFGGMLVGDVFFRRYLVLSICTFLALKEGCTFVPVKNRGTSVPVKQDGSLVGDVFFRRYLRRMLTYADVC